MAWELVTVNVNGYKIRCVRNGESAFASALDIFIVAEKLGAVTRVTMRDLANYLGLPQTTVGVAAGVFGIDNSKLSPIAVMIGHRYVYDFLLFSELPEPSLSNLTDAILTPLGFGKGSQSQPSTSPIVVNPTEADFLRTLFDAIDKYGIYVSKGDTQRPEGAVGNSVVTWDQYADVASSKMVGDASDKEERLRKSFPRMTDGLVKYGVLRVEWPFMWWTGKPIRGFPRTFSSGSKKHVPCNPFEKIALIEQKIDRIQHSLNKLIVEFSLARGGGEESIQAEVERRVSEALGKEASRLYAISKRSAGEGVRR